MKNSLIKKSGVILLTVAMLPTLMFAHSGRTDQRGGHRDNKNKSGLGSYHYHCGGYPAHLHSNGVCPYSYDSKSDSEKNTNKVSKYKEREMDFIIDGSNIKINSINIDNTNLVELKGLCEKLDISINYDSELQSIDCIKGKNAFTLQINSKDFWLNGNLQTLNVAPIVQNGRTMVSARVVAEAIGKSVTYDELTDQIIIK